MEKKNLQKRTKSGCCVYVNLPQLTVLKSYMQNYRLIKVTIKFGATVNTFLPVPYFSDHKEHLKFKKIKHAFY